MNRAFVFAALVIALAACNGGSASPPPFPTGTPRFFSGAITEFPSGAGLAIPWSITPGPDGNLWFTELIGGVGRRV